MAHTLLSAVNRAFKRVRLIQGDAGALTTLTDSPRQADIDIMVQAFQEVTQDLLEVCEMANSEIGTGTITLVDSTREYATASDFEGMATNVMVDQTNGYYLHAYPGGYEAMFSEQLQPSNHTGSPHFYAINPTNGNFRLDAIPTSNEAGRVYTYNYRKTIRFSTATDTFPFSDQIVEELMPAVKEVWNRESKEKFDQAIYQRAMARAAKSLTQAEQKKYW